MRFFSLRAILLLGFIIVMPVLALPSVARRIDEWLYGPPPADFGRPPVPPPLTDEPLIPVARSPVAPARFDEPSPASRSFVQPASAVSELAPATSPPLPTSPPLAGASPVFASAIPPPEPQIDERILGRLQQIRQRLEDFGAEYVLVDTQESGRYRFHCRMLVDARSRSTRSFDATSFDPVAAGEQVLSDVEKWRTAAAPVPTGYTP